MQPRPERKWPNCLAPDDPDRQLSGFIRLERVVRDVFAADPSAQEELMTAYHAIYTRVLNQGRATANQFLHDCASYLEWNAGDSEDGEAD